MQDDFLLDSSIATNVGEDDLDFRQQFKIDSYFAAWDIIMNDINDCFGMQTTEIIRLMSSMCIRRDRQPDDYDNIPYLELTYKLDRERCAD